MQDSAQMPAGKFKESHMAEQAYERQCPPAVNLFMKSRASDAQLCNNPQIPSPTDWFPLNSKKEHM